MSVLQKFCLSEGRLTTKHGAAHLQRKAGPFEVGSSKTHHFARDGRGLE
jgi:hypothetical protein